MAGRKRIAAAQRNILAALLEEAKSECFHLGQHLEVVPALVFEQACAMGLEGIVCKLRDAPYRSGSRASWLKIKCFKHGVFPIIGFIPAPGAIAALHLGRREGKALAYAGRAGTSFSEKTARELRQVLDALATDRPPVRGAPLKPKSRRRLPGAACSWPDCSPRCSASENAKQFSGP